MALLDPILDYPRFTPDIDHYVSANCGYIDVPEISSLYEDVQFSILMLNIRSCKKNFNQFLACFCNFFTFFSCIVLTETWLTPERDNIFSIPGFYFYDLYRNHLGGGIKVYLKNDIRSRLLTDFTLINDS